MLLGFDEGGIYKIIAQCVILNNTWLKIVMLDWENKKFNN
jgi:hypothetical protein